MPVWQSQIVRHSKENPKVMVEEAGSEAARLGKTILLDYVWRENTTFDNDRVKVMKKPKQVNYLDIHDTKGGNPRIQLKSFRKLHIQQYKQP